METGATDATRTSSSEPYHTPASSQRSRCELVLDGRPLLGMAKPAV